ncbi:unnamed protein product [Prorocentrum cordatum]|uniref:PH domain-containing protein n=1 Tax=Prorocentrum cordatum TaxID=2364126 RepID=A0ABN9PRR7_9DINO|nr:unnamed protein product [Polarella glacialis]
MTAEELKQRCRLRDSFVELCIEEAKLVERQQSPGAPAPPLTSAGTGAEPILEDVTARLRQMQMSLPVQEIISWRMLARQRRYDRENPDDEGDEDEEERKALEELEKREKIPSTMQARVHFRGFQAYFLIVVGDNWQNAMAKRLEEKAAKNPGAAGGRRKSPMVSALLKQLTSRQLVIKGEVLDVNVEAVQKGRARHRVGRWAELRVGSVSVTNCNVKDPNHATRHILSISPFEKNKGGAPICVFVGATMLDQQDDDYESNVVPIVSVLEPWGGAASHLREVSGAEEEETLERLGFLRDTCVKEGPESRICVKEGKVLTCVFGRCGQVRALDYTPFRRRMMKFLTRGMGAGTTDLVRRPSPLALDRELLVKLQRRVQLLVGKSMSMGIVEGVVDGVKARMVDHYNSQHVLCKEVSLAPLRCKALHNGNPQTFHMQLHQLLKSGDGEAPASLGSLGSRFGLLPWKVAMLLLPKADFVMGVEVADQGFRRSLLPDPDQKGPLGRPVSQSTSDSQAVNISSGDPVQAVNVGAMFTKWCKNGKFQKRFVVFVEEYDVIIWKKSASDSKITGVLPLASVQDICIGPTLQTPVLQKARAHPKMRPDRLLSVIANDRTLDLQADTAEIQQRWLQGLKERFKMHVQNHIQIEEDAITALPKHLVKKQKKYPEKFRSDRCALRSSYRMVQANAALGRLLTRGSEAGSSLPGDPDEQDAGPPGKEPGSASGRPVTAEASFTESL